MVRLPDTTGQMKSAREVPVRVMRGFFAGIGQLLLAADRFRAEEAQREGTEPDEQDGPPTGLDGEHSKHPMTTADYVRSATPPPGMKGQSSTAHKFRSLDSTNNVRVLTPDMPAESSPDDDLPAPQTRRRKPARAARSMPPAAVVELPVPGFDELSLASLRARLRNLDAAQVRTLLEHEMSAGNRADVIGMLERRVAKLEARHDAP